MITENMKSESMVCVCPECKNNIDLSRYPNLEVGMVIECNYCGMTLLIKEIELKEIKTEIVDAGK